MEQIDYWASILQCTHKGWQNDQIKYGYINNRYIGINHLAILFFRYARCRERSIFFSWCVSLLLPKSLHLLTVAFTAFLCWISFFIIVFIIAIIVENSVERDKRRSRKNFPYIRTRVRARTYQRDVYTRMRVYTFIIGFFTSFLSRVALRKLNAPSMVIFYATLEKLQYRRSTV